MSIHVFRHLTWWLKSAWVWGGVAAREGSALVQELLAAIWIQDSGHRLGETKRMHSDRLPPSLIEDVEASVTRKRIKS